MNLKFLANLAKKYPHYARFLEFILLLIIANILGGLASYLITGNPLDWPLILAEVIAPIQSAVGKRMRDLKKTLNVEEPKRTDI